LIDSSPHPDTASAGDGTGLDLARYADSNGMDENVAYANAFRYRDYVIHAFNADKPYVQFVKEQIAGDLLLLSRTGDDRLNYERLTATGFLVIGPKMARRGRPGEDGDGHHR